MIARLRELWRCWREMKPGKRGKLDTKLAETDRVLEVARITNARYERELNLYSGGKYGRQRFES